MAGELLGQLEARRLGGDDAVHDARLLQHHQVPVDRALGEAVTGFEDLREREGAWRAGEHLDDRSALRRESLLHPSQAR